MSCRRLPQISREDNSRGTTPPNWVTEKLKNLLYQLRQDFSPAGGVP
jgi:hypothetical protein